MNVFRVVGWLLGWIVCMAAAVLFCDVSPALSMACLGCCFAVLLLLAPREARS